MKTAELTKRVKEIAPSFDSSNTFELINRLEPKILFSTYITILKDISSSTDIEISRWLNMTPKTLRGYKLSKKAAPSLQVELTIQLISLFKHGLRVFGEPKNFKEWLDKENFFFDKKKPSAFMSTISGLKYIDDRLTGMEYGDNA